MPQPGDAAAARVDRAVAAAAWAGAALLLAAVVGDQAGAHMGCLLDRIGWGLYGVALAAHSLLLGANIFTVLSRRTYATAAVAVASNVLVAAVYTATMPVRAALRRWWPAPPDLLEQYHGAALAAQAALCVGAAGIALCAALDGVLLGGWSCLFSPLGSGCGICALAFTGYVYWASARRAAPIECDDVSALPLDAEAL